MPHHTPLIGTLVIAIMLAFILGAGANRLRISPLDAEVEHLQKHGANFVIMGEREIALGMLDHALGPAADAAASTP